jgi:hypothetical protein
MATVSESPRWLTRIPSHREGGNAMNFDIVIVETDEVLLNHGAI